MIIGLRKENFDYFKKQVYHGTVRKDKLFAFLKLRSGKKEYRSRDNTWANDATLEPSEVKEIITLSNGVTLLDIKRKAWKPEPVGYEFPQDLEGYVPVIEALSHTNDLDKLMLASVGLSV